MKVSTDYSEFITDRFNNKTPEQFFSDLKLYAHSDEFKTIVEECIEDELDDYLSSDIDEETGKKCIMIHALSHHVFYDIFDLEDHIDYDLIAPGSFLDHTYSDYEELIEEMYKEISKTLFK